MKKNLLLLFVTGLFYGCSGKNDGPAAPLSSAIVGKWIAQKDTSYTYHNNDAPIISTGVLANSYIVFNGDGTGLQVFEMYKDNFYNFRYTITDKTIAYNVPGQTHGNFIVEGGHATNEVKSITSSKLHLYQESEFIRPDGEHYRSVYSMYYVKGK
ncbi:hypothetical protein AAFN85_21005 [Mucilaginibacter sp. CAU 1740]|uniref:hypothetical protein n=1 Tax=Mucilaginibacter sp. CAU 1740 TaxID=3140365 RepID=UPI00325A4BC1